MLLVQIQHRLINNILHVNRNKLKNTETNILKFKQKRARNKTIKQQLTGNPNNAITNVLPVS